MLTPKDENDPTEVDLSAFKELGFLIDRKSGIFVAPLPTEREGFKIVLHPRFFIGHSDVHSNGTTVLSVKKSKPTVAKSDVEA